MATTDERRAFGQRLRDLREDKDWSLERLAELLRAEGTSYTAANVGAWERGQYAPRTRAAVRALEKLLDAPGELSACLGWVSEPDLVVGDHEIRLSASGVDLAELAELDPEGYASIVGQAEMLLRRARERREQG